MIPKELVEKLKTEVDDLVYLDVPENFSTVGQFYEDFSQTSDEEVKGILGSTRYGTL